MRKGQNERRARAYDLALNVPRGRDLTSIDSDDSEDDDQSSHPSSHQHGSPYVTPRRYRRSPSMRREFADLFCNVFGRASTSGVQQEPATPSAQPTAAVQTDHRVAETRRQQDGASTSSANADPSSIDQRVYRILRESGQSMEVAQQVYHLLRNARLSTTSTNAQSMEQN